VFWYDNNWKDMKRVYEFDTVEDFWGLQNNVSRGIERKIVRRESERERVRERERERERERD
jgi:hypothetical protein